MRYLVREGAVSRVQLNAASSAERTLYRMRNQIVQYGEQIRLSTERDLTISSIMEDN